MHVTPRYAIKFSSDMTSGHRPAHSHQTADEPPILNIDLPAMVLPRSSVDLFNLSSKKKPSTPPMLNIDLPAMVLPRSSVDLSNKKSSNQS